MSMRAGRVGAGWVRTIASVALLALAGGPAWAQCFGTSILPQIEARDPLAYARITAEAATVPNAEGRYWEAQIGDAPPSTLYGTFHATELLDSIDTSVWRRLEWARVAYFEVDLDQRNKMDERVATDPEFLFDTTLKPLSSRLSPADRRRIGEALAERGLDFGAVEYMRPWLLASILAFPACRIRDMATGAKNMDAAMAERAALLGVPVVGLESYQQAIAGFDRIDDDLLLQAIISAPLAKGLDEDVFRTNADLYLEGKIALIARLGVYLMEKTMPGINADAVNDAVMSEIVDARNFAWLDRIDDAIRKGGAFVAVGALHLPGDEGLIAMLRRRGVRVTRLD